MLLSACGQKPLPPPPPPIETRLVEVPLDPALTAEVPRPATEEAKAALVGAPPQMVAAILLSFIFRQDMVIADYEARMACIRARQAGKACTVPVVVPGDVPAPP